MRAVAIAVFSAAAVTSPAARRLPPLLNSDTDPVTEEGCKVSGSSFRQ
jgi:hypothetical protein